MSHIKKVEISKLFGELDINWFRGLSFSSKNLNLELIPK